MARTGALVTFDEFRALWDEQRAPLSEAVAAGILQRGAQRGGWAEWPDGGAADEQLLERAGKRSLGWIPWDDAR